MKVLVQGAWAACGFVKIPGTNWFTFDSEILMGRLPKNISRVPVCKRITDEKLKKITGECIDNVIADNEHKRKREEKEKENKQRKKVAEHGLVSTSEKFLAQLKLDEEEKAAKKAAKEAKNAEKQSKNSKSVQKKSKNQNIAAFFAKK